MLYLAIILYITVRSMFAITFSCSSYRGSRTALPSPAGASGAASPPVPVRTAPPSSSYSRGIPGSDPPGVHGDPRVAVVILVIGGGDDGRGGAAAAGPDAPDAPQVADPAWPARGVRVGRHLDVDLGRLRLRLLRLRRVQPVVRGAAGHVLGLVDELVELVGELVGVRWLLVLRRRVKLVHG